MAVTVICEHCGKALFFNNASKARKVVIGAFNADLCDVCADKMIAEFDSRRVESISITVGRDHFTGAVDE